MCQPVLSLLNKPWFWYGVWFYVITGLGTLATQLGMYSYDMFVSGYGLSSVDIFWVQIVFAVWNVLNDLLGGYLSDWYNHKFGGRLALIIPFNILWCLATVIPYYELGLRPYYSIHYLIYICLNDTFLSVQSIVTSAVWVDDLTKNENERIKLSLVTKPIGFCVGFTIIWFSYLYFDKDHLDRFHILYWCAFAISVFFTILAYFALTYLLKKYNLAANDEQQLSLLQCDQVSDDHDQSLAKQPALTSITEDAMHSVDKSIDNNQDHKKQPLISAPLDDEHKETDKSFKILKSADEDDDDLNETEDEKRGTFSMKIFCKDIIKQPNLWWFIIASVINEFQGIFLGQYRPIFVDVFLGDLDEYWRSTYIAVLSNGGVVIEIAILLISFKVGCAYFVRLGILLRLVTAIAGIIVLVALYSSEYNFHWNIGLAVFCMLWLFSFQLGFIFFINFWNMVMANIVYEQRAYRIRNGLVQLSSMTSMYWAIHACCAKPFNGVGTIIGTYVIENAGYGGPDGVQSFDELTAARKGILQYTLLQLTAWFMFVTSLIQFACFRNYDLENQKLAEVERVVNEYEETQKRKKQRRDANKNGNEQKGATKKSVMSSENEGGATARTYGSTAT